MSTPRWQMLPGGLLEEPGAKRTTRDWIVDVMMTLIAIGIGTITLGETEDLHSEGMILLDLVLGVAAIVALWWRRRWPLGVVLLISAFGVVSASSAGAGLLALFNVALRGSRRALLIATAAGLILSAVAPLVYDDPEIPYVFEVLLGVAITLLVVPWGLFTRTQRDLLRSSHERAQQLEAEQRAHVEQAREAERRRIAGEMHDVLAHRLSLLSVHAGALEFRPDAPPEEIAEAAAVIRRTARDALQDLREVIGVLRERPDAVAPPQPTLDEIPALIEESRAAGHEGQLADRGRRRRGDGRADRLPGRAGRADQRAQARARRGRRGHRRGRRAARRGGRQPALRDLRAGVGWRFRPDRALRARGARRRGA